MNTGAAGCCYEAENRDRTGGGENKTGAMKVIGLTGPSGAGKTTVLHVFAALGTATVDADAVYHALLSSDGALLEAVRERFPAAFLSARGTAAAQTPPRGALDRKALGRIVFQDADALLDLERITHPAVLAETARRLEIARKAGARAAVVDAIALFQSGLDAVCDVTVGVLADRDTRAARIVARDGITLDYAFARINAQPDDAYYQKHCDYILHNNQDGGEHLAARAKQLYCQMLEA